MKGFMGFRGGVHPSESKLTAGKPIRIMPAPGRVVIPMSMHIGAPCKPAVAKGDQVKLGQVVGEAGGAVSAAVYASVSGTVADVVERLTAMGRFERSVVIDSDGADEPVEPWARVDSMSIPVDEARARIRAAGVVGLGGAAFPTSIKISPPPNMKIDTVILNGAECEPYLTADHRIMLERTAEILDGARIFRRIFDIPEVIIAVERNKPDALEALARAAGRGHGIRIEPLAVKYPQGAEKQLIRALTGREVPSGGLPMHVGALVQNVGTALAVSEAVTAGKPLYERVMTVTGSGIAEPGNILVRIGTLIADVVEFCGGYSGPVEKLIMGGPMMGIALFTDQVPAVKGTSGILALRPEDAPVYKQRSCIRCGRCVEACPMGLEPSQLGVMVENLVFDKLDENNILDCIECGSCNYICPAKRRLVHYLRTGKQQVQIQRDKERRRREEKEAKEKEQTAQQPV